MSRSVRVGASSSGQQLEGQRDEMLIRESSSTIAESHRPKFPDLSIFKLERGLSRYYDHKWLLNSEGVNVLSTDSKNRLKLMFTTELSQDLEDVEELPDFFDLLE